MVPAKPSLKAYLSWDLAIYMDFCGFFLTHIFHETQIFAMATGVSHDLLLHKQHGKLLLGNSLPCWKYSGNILRKISGHKQMKVREEQVTVYYGDPVRFIYSLSPIFLSSFFFFLF